MVDDLLLDEPCFVRVLRVLCEIRDGINDLAGSRESGLINEVLDLDLIKQQISTGAFNWETCMNTFISVFEIIKKVQVFFVFSSEN